MIDNSQMTGEKLFLMYAFPCSYSMNMTIGKDGRKRISDENFIKLRTLIESGNNPSRSILKKCFPNAVKALRESALLVKDMGIFNMWDTHIVRLHWRKQHVPNQKNDRSCHVRVAIVSQIIDEDKIRVLCEGLYSVVINMYKLPVHINSLVYVHRYTIVEVAG